MKCVSCDWFGIETTFVSRCPLCGSQFEFRYAPSPASHDEPTDSATAATRLGIWRYWDRLPVANPGYAITLGEGTTPLLDCRKLAKQTGVAKLLVKDEGQNPTGSFKDRTACVGVSRAAESGVQEIAIASDANAGPSTAAYAARAGLACHVFMPEVSSPTRVNQALAFGAHVYVTRAEGLVSDCINLVETLSAEFDWSHLTTAREVNPYQTEGTKTLAYELHAQVEGRWPDWLVLSAGGGGLIVGVLRGIRELTGDGQMGRPPKVLCVQGEACAPIASAILTRQPVQRTKLRHATVAVPIAVPWPLDGTEAVRGVLSTGGSAVSVTDEEVLGAVARLAELEGISASPAGAVAVAGAVKAVREGIIQHNESIVTVVTATGMKDLADDLADSRRLHRISADARKAATVVRSHSSSL